MFSRFNQSKRVTVKRREIRGVDYICTYALNPSLIDRGGYTIRLAVVRLYRLVGRLRRIYLIPGDPAASCMQIMTVGHAEWTLF